MPWWRASPSCSRCAAGQCLAGCQRASAKRRVTLQPAQPLTLLPLPPLQLLLGSMHSAVENLFAPATQARADIAAVEASLQRCIALTKLSLIVYAGPGVQQGLLA